jgi:tRNA threonylcarbamoyl adenosine modification protein YeaZ
MPTVTIALETCIGEPDAAILVQGAVIDSSSIVDAVKFEVVLAQIGELLRRNGLDRKQIGTIVIGTGPGSLTGRRVGLSTGLGLQSALRCELRTISSLEAIATAPRATGLIYAVISDPRGHRYARLFKVDFDQRTIAARSDVRQFLPDEAVDIPLNIQFAVLAGHRHPVPHSDEPSNFLHLSGRIAPFVGIASTFTLIT